MAAVGTPEPPTTKEQLELLKLKLEIRNLNRTFYAQIANTICIAILGLAVLLLYQWPQLQQMEAARVSNEQIQVARLVEDAQNIKNPADRSRMLRSIAYTWSQYAFTLDIATADDTGTKVTEITKPSTQPSQGNSEVSQACIELVTQLADLRASRVRLQNDADREEMGQGQTRFRGRGNFWNAISQQIAEADRQIAIGSAKLAEFNCRTR